MPFFDASWFERPARRSFQARRGLTDVVVLRGQDCDGSAPNFRNCDHPRSDGCMSESRQLAISKVAANVPTLARPGDACRDVQDRHLYPVSLSGHDEEQ
jgi:hypothetical protein